MSIGYTRNMILGIDEVGRGPWAGPLVVGAVVLGGAKIDGLADSKKLTKRKRELLAEAIRQNAAGYALGWVDATELDTIGLSSALRLATRRAVEQIRTPYHEIIIDGTINFLADTALEKYVTLLPKADALVPSVSAASIIAKVARDAYMKQQDAVYPGYGFGQNAGYGVALHRQAIDRLGVTPLHRLSFAPLVRYADKNAIREVIEETKRVSVELSVGRRAEAVAGLFLQRHGHTIRARNWKTKWCEIDIVSEKNGQIYFTEVKHRASSKSGDGLEAITPAKLKQMKFAAELYLVNHPGAIGQLACISTTGEEPEVVEYLECI